MTNHSWITPTGREGGGGVKYRTGRKDGIRKWKIKATRTRVTTRNDSTHWRDIRKHSWKLTEQKQLDLSGSFVPVFPQILINHFTPFHRSFVLRADRAAHFGSLDSRLSNSGLSGAWVDGKTVQQPPGRFKVSPSRRSGGREREREEKALAPKTRPSKCGANPHRGVTRSAHFSTAPCSKSTRCSNIKCPPVCTLETHQRPNVNKSRITAKLREVKTC